MCHESLFFVCDEAVVDESSSINECIDCAGWASVFVSLGERVIGSIRSIPSFPRTAGMLKQRLYSGW